MTTLRCIVPFCKRTTSLARQNRGYQWGEITEWICGNHWRNVPAAYRRAYSRIGRRYRRSPNNLIWRCWLRLWSRCKRAAIEAAAGIG